MKHSFRKIIRKISSFLSLNTSMNLVISKPMKSVLDLRLISKAKMLYH